MALMAVMLPAFEHTIDDAFISYRYARNLAAGHGLVFNPAQRVEGYTNLLWTLLLSAAIRLNLDPDAIAKGLGTLGGLGVIAATCFLSRQLQPEDRRQPCIATWLVATSAPILSFSVSGMETSVFVALILLGLALVVHEEQAGSQIPWSGMAFGICALLRPETVMYVGVTTIGLGLGALSRRSLVRLGAFAVPALGQAIWRYSYYSEWLPNTFVAKTAGLTQASGGLLYLRAYADSSRCVVALSLIGLGLLAVRRGRAGAGVVLPAAATVVYVVLIGGDWMPNFRFLAALDPLLFIAADHAFATVVPSLKLPRKQLATVVVVALMILAFERYRVVARSRRHIDAERALTNAIYVPTARWLRRQHPGLVAVGDIGRIGWVSDFPVLDLYGLVDPFVARLPGVDRAKFGAGYREHVLGSRPAYVVVRSRGGECSDPKLIPFAQLLGDSRFERWYSEAIRFRAGPELLCTYVRNDRGDGGES